MNKYILHIVLAIFLSFLAQGEKTSNTSEITLSNLEEQLALASTGAQRAILHKKIASSKNLNLILTSLSTQLSSGVLKECFESNDNQFKSELTLMVLKSDLKVWEWANTTKPQILSGGMGVAYMEYAQACIKVLQEYFPEEQFVADDFRFKNKRLKFANRLEIKLGKKSKTNNRKPLKPKKPRISNNSNKEIQNQRNKIKNSSQEDSTASINPNTFQKKWFVALAAIFVLGGVFIWLKSKSPK